MSDSQQPLNLFAQLVDHRGGLYSVYDLNDKLVEVTPDRDRALELVKRIQDGRPLQFDQDGLKS